MNGTGRRIGAAAFALGLSVTAPQAVASADGTRGDSAVESAADSPSQPTTRGARAETQRRPGSAVSRGARTQPAAAAIDSAGVGSADIAGIDKAARGQSPAADGVGRKPAAVAAPETPTVRTSPGPGVEIPEADPAAGQVPAATASASAAEVAARAIATAPVIATAASCGGCAALGAPTPVPVAGQAVTAVVQGAKFLDDIGNWLHSLPANPVNDLLSGALLLLRRNLFPTVPTIPAVSVGNIMLVEDSPQAVFTVTLDRAYRTPVTVGYATGNPPQNPAAEPADQAAPATVGADYQTASGVVTFAPGQTSRQVSVAILADPVAEVSETFTMNLFAVTGSDELTPVRLGSATATIVDDDRVRIDVNPNFAYGDVLLATIFSDLAYNHRDDADFSSRVEATGWEGIGIAQTDLSANGYSPTAGGYGVRDGLTMQSYAFAGKRTAADGTEQFVVAFEGSNIPPDEWIPADWALNAGRYGWSQYYSSLEPLMTKVVGQMLEAQKAAKKTQLIITGHSLGGAAAMMAFADLLAPEGNLWPGTSDVLAAGRRVLDSTGGWSPEVRTALLADTTVYTFGAPSILIEPNKLAAADALAFAATVGSGLLSTLGLLAKTIGVLTVDDSKLPDFTGIAGINFGTRVFQFEHANTSWLPPYPGDVVAQIGSRDPGTVLEINLDNAVHRAYTNLLTQFVPGGTHPMAGYRESVTRLVTNTRVLKDPNKLAGSSPQLPQTSPGTGSDARNDFFVNASDSGGEGNDLFVFSQAGSYAANGEGGSDAYSISSYDVALLIDGSRQSGRDTVVFDLAGTPGAAYYNTGSGPRNDTAVFSVTGSDGRSSSVTITGWDHWQVTDVLQVIKPADGRWTLDVWTDIERGPVVATSPADEIPLSVL